jgi:hypothetical protein
VHPAITHRGNALIKIKLTVLRNLMYEMLLKNKRYAESLHTKMAIKFLNYCKKTLEYDEISVL